MSERISRGKRILIEQLELPKEVVLDVPRIVIVGKSEITVENHKGILVFDREEMKINTKFGPLSIKGRNFEILYISAGTITISGVFGSIAYEGEE